HQVNRRAPCPPHARAQRQGPAVPGDARGGAGRPDLPGRRGWRGAAHAQPYRRKLLRGVPTRIARRRRDRACRSRCRRSGAVAGRKLIYLMGSGRSSDELLRATGYAVAGVFDLYVCTDWARRPRPDPQTVPDLMRDGLLAGGVTPDAILSIVGEEEALRHILWE